MIRTDGIREWIRKGYSPGDIISIFYDGTIEPTELQNIIEQEYLTLIADQEDWGTTDCDRLDEVFESLNNMGVLALQNISWCLTDGYCDMREVFNTSDNKCDIKGYCYYHGQDLDNAYSHGNLYLTFGAIDEDAEESEDISVGKIIVSALESHGFTVEWDGKCDQRICVNNFDWKKRVNMDIFEEPPVMTDAERALQEAKRIPGLQMLEMIRRIKIEKCPTPLKS
jgi:Domain of unknown function (DUF6891)